jgi:nitrate/nitrite transport system substrate-binding protein
MPTLNPYDPDQPLSMSCACGARHDLFSCSRSSPAQPSITQASAAPAVPSVESQVENHQNQMMEASLVKAIFPNDSLRRRFLKVVGASTARAAIAAALPVGALSSLQAMAQERGVPEKKDLKIGFLPITCASPLIMADPLGLYKKEGLNVQLIKTPGWGVIRDRLLQHELDATHLLSPMPLAMSLGMGAAPMGMHVASIQNTNGNAITLHVKHKDKRNPKQWKGMTLAIPFEHSMHNYLLRYYLAEHGVHPDRDVKLRVMPPPDMVAALKEQRIDGFIVADPFNQRAVFDGVGFIHLLTKDIWDGHPCCAFGTSTEFIQKNPNSFAALYRAIISSSILASQPGARDQIVKAIAPKPYLNQPEELLSQILTGRFDDGLGNTRNVPDRILFDPVPWQSMAVWMLTQMKRWGYLKGDVNYQQIAEKVFMLTDAKKQMASSGWRAPDGAYRKHRIMGKSFDAAAPEDYLKGFELHNMA